MPSKKTSNSTALAQGVAFQNPALTEGLDDTLDILQANLGADSTVGLGDLDRVRVPNGARSFVVPTLEGDENENEIEGIVLLARTARAYWPTNTISDEPPQCYSDDGVTGHGNPGGPCSSCKLAQFGSAAHYVEGAAKDGNGQACKQSALVFLLTEDGFLPKVLRLAPTSLKAWRQYMIALTGRKLHHLDVLTTFTVELDKNDAGQPFSRVVPRFGGRLSAESKEQVRTLANMIVPRLRTVRVPDDEDQPVDLNTSSDEPNDGDNEF